ncbi:MAG: hypothetical protein ACI90V_006600 [Bacillariaceae sp.]|jgi:hypothetical protein
MIMINSICVLNDYLLINLMSVPLHFACYADSYTVDSKKYYIIYLQ